MGHSEWYFSIDGQQFGPISSKQLRELAATGRLKPSDLVWRPGLKTWVPAAKIKGLFPSPPAFPHSPSSTKDQVLVPHTSDKSVHEPPSGEPATGFENAEGRAEGSLLAEPIVEPLPWDENDDRLQSEDQAGLGDRDRLIRGAGVGDTGASEVFAGKSVPPTAPLPLQPPGTPGMHSSREVISLPVDEVGVFVLGPTLAWTVPCVRQMNRAMPLLLLVALVGGAACIGLWALAEIITSSGRFLLPGLAWVVAAVGVGLLAFPAAEALRTVARLGEGVNPAPVTSFSVWTAAAAVWLVGFALLLWNCHLADRFSDWIFLIGAFFWFVLGQFSALALVTASAVGPMVSPKETLVGGKNDSARPVAQSLGWAARVLGLLSPGWVGICALWGAVLIFHGLLLDMPDLLGQAQHHFDRWGELSGGFSEVEKGIKPDTVRLTGIFQLIGAAVLPFFLSLVVSICRMGFELSALRDENARSEPEG